VPAGNGRVQSAEAGRCRPPRTDGDAMKAEDAVCVCGHPHRAHEHHRRGTECALCGPEVCARFRRESWWRRLAPRRWFSQQVVTGRESLLFL